MKRPITPRGYNAQRRELHKLKGMRPELAMAIEIARGHGDLSENGDYDAAKEKSGMIEAKIRDIEAKLSFAEVIDPRKLGTPTRVLFGTTTKVLDMDADEEKTFTIVGADETNIDKNWISCESPLGKSLIGKEIGEVIKARVPGGEKEFEILEVFIDYVDDTEEEATSEA